LLDTDQKIILLNHQNNLVRTLKNNEQCKKFYVLATDLNVLHNYFDSLTKLLF